MRRVVFWLWISISSLSAQYVTLYNVSHPNTAIEVGNTVQVVITGAPPYGTVTLVLDGGGPYQEGQTDGSGNFSITATETSDYIGPHEEHWYVNGVEMTPSNQDATYLRWAPTLPSFTVYANFTGTNCPTQSMSFSGCGTGNNPFHWIWSPVTYDFLSMVVDASTVDGDARNWNSIQNKLSFSSDASTRLDLWIYDDASLGTAVYGETITFGQDCDSSCYNQLDLCTGACFNSAAVYYVNTALNPPQIATLAGNLRTATATVAAYTLAHEMGHALRLGDIAPVNGICSEVQSIMYGSGSVLYGCGVAAPNSCDASGVDNVYPSPVGYCPSNMNNTCNGTPCF